MKNTLNFYLKLVYFYTIARLFSLIIPLNSYILSKVSDNQSFRYYQGIIYYFNTNGYCFVPFDVLALY